MIRFSQPLSAGAVDDLSLSPATPGTWTLSTPTTLRFVPKGAFAPFSTVHVTVRRRVTSVVGVHLRTPVRFSFSIGAPSQARLEQLLAMQSYLPLRFRPAHRQRWTRAADQIALFAPPAGRLRFESGWPATLHILWAHDSGLMIRGAVMAFESEHGMTMDGIAGPAVWSALERAQERGQRSSVAYSYAIASESEPETLTVWHAGREVLRTLANTGIPGQPTALGSYPVYERLRSQVMQGTNPDGSHYADPVSWVAYFNGGDAVHYFPRASFGYPQSLGCVELPYSAAQTAWGYLTYGTLVTVAP
ncbi:MAG: L,D-transpeptidase family protein [Solirubrobacteraceae bacterium]